MYWHRKLKKVYEEFMTISISIISYMQFILFVFCIFMMLSMNSFAVIISMFALSVLIALEFYIKNKENEE